VTSTFLPKSLPERKFRSVVLPHPLHTKTNEN